MHSCQSRDKRRGISEKNLFYPRLQSFFNHQAQHHHDSMSMMRDIVQGCGQKKWWYQIAMMGMLCVFFVGIDVYNN